MQAACLCVGVRHSCHAGCLLSGHMPRLSVATCPRVVAERRQYLLPGPQTHGVAECIRAVCPGANAGFPSLNVNCLPLSLHVGAGWCDVGCCQQITFYLLCPRVGAPGSQSHLQVASLQSSGCCKACCLPGILQAKVCGARHPRPVVACCRAPMLTWRTPTRTHRSIMRLAMAEQTPLRCCSKSEPCSTHPVLNQDSVSQHPSA